MTLEIVITNTVKATPNAMESMVKLLARAR
jgi:hypothetical protein